jgi:hypothetical protein
MTKDNLEKANKIKEKIDQFQKVDNIRDFLKIDYGRDNCFGYIIFINDIDFINKVKNLAYEKTKELEKELGSL